MKPEMHDGWGMHDPRQEATGDREAYLGMYSWVLSPSVRMISPSCNRQLGSCCC